MTHTIEIDPETQVVVPKSALDWLFGEAPDANGQWFSEVCPDDTNSKRYWWRVYFRKLISAPAVEPVPLGDVGEALDAIQNYINADANMVRVGLEHGYDSEQHDRADDVFMACRKPAKEALTTLRRALTATAVQPAPMVDGWMPIETAPKDGTLILASAYNLNGKWLDPRVIMWSSKKHYWILPDLGLSLLVEPIFWQPLPEKPYLPTPQKAG